jgi:small subunit ribosomal protein S9
MVTTKKNVGITYLASSVGRRKTSVARVYMAEGSGKIEINKRDIVNYFPKGTNRYEVNQPMNLLKLANKYDLNINVVGGGPSGQAGAIRLGIARALLKIDPNFKPELRAAGFLTRDSRKVERKKAGLAGARRRFQYSKR